jgi:hypothetical protein
MVFERLRLGAPNEGVAEKPGQQNDRWSSAHRSMQHHGFGEPWPWLRNEANGLFLAIYE